MLLYLVLDISTYHVLVLLLRPHICLLWQREVIDEPSTVCLLPPFFLKKKWVGYTPSKTVLMVSMASSSSCVGWFIKLPFESGFLRIHICVTTFVPSLVWPSCLSPTSHSLRTLHCGGVTIANPPNFKKHMWQVMHHPSMVTTICIY